MSLVSLQNYGEWYYTRYFPSIRVLREKILKKSQDENLTNSVMENLQPLFIEKNIIESRVHEYISQWKTLYFIRQKLSQKKFDIILVQEVLWQAKDILEDPETYRKVIQARCKKAENKGFSRKKILYELQWCYPDARNVIEEVLNSYSDTDILENKILPRLLHVHPEEKVIQKCLQAGFTFWDTRNALKNMKV